MAKVENKKETVETVVPTNQPEVVKEKKEAVKGGPCGSCKWWDTTTTRDFRRDGIRKGLVECRSVCRSPTAKASGHLTKKESVRPCYEKGKFVPAKKESKPEKTPKTVAGPNGEKVPVMGKTKPVSSARADGSRT